MGFVSTARLSFDERRSTCTARRDRADPSDDGRFAFGLATEPLVLDAAFRLVHDQYVKLGYIAPDPTGRRLGIHNALPTTRVFVARRESDVVGTVTLIADSPLGVPMDEIYSEELDALRQAGRRLAEVSALAVADDDTINGGAIVLGLVRLVFLFVAEFGDVDDLCIAVNPRHAAFYDKLLNFRQLGSVRRYARVNGAPAVAFSINLASVESAFTKARDRSSRHQAIYAFLLGHSDRLHRQLILEQLRPWANKGGMTSESYRRFFGDGLIRDRFGGAAAEFVQSLYAEENLLRQPARGILSYEGSLQRWALSGRGRPAQLV